MLEAVKGELSRQQGNVLFADNVRHVMMHSAQTRLWHGSVELGTIMR